MPSQLTKTLKPEMLWATPVPTAHLFCRLHILLRSSTGSGFGVKPHKEPSPAVKAFAHTETQALRLQCSRISRVYIGVR